MRSPRHRVAALAVLATAVMAVLIPAAGTTAEPEPSLGVLRAKLADAIAEEKRVLALLSKEPPRTETAKLVLKRAQRLLKEILGSGRFAGKGPLVQASAEDISAAVHLGHEVPELLGAQWTIRLALLEKRTVMALLQQPSSAQGPQCGDRRDNDGDGTIDARHDSGCTSKTDGTERSALTCSLGYKAGAPVSVVQGTCSGTFAKLELTAPAGAVFDTKAMPAVQQAQACRYASERKLECVMSDGVANPRHVVNARFKLTKLSVSGPRVLIRDFSGRGRTWPTAPTQPAPPTANVDPVSARCAARFDFSVSRLAVRCDGVDVKSSSASTGRPISAVRAADAVSAGLASRCEPVQVSGSGQTAGKCFWKAGNKGKTLSFQLTHGEPLGAVTIHVLAGGSGEGGTTIVLRQTWRPLEGFLCQQEVPRADTCATL